MPSQASEIDAVRDPAIARALRANEDRAGDLVGAGEMALMMGTGALAQPAAGLGGLGAGLAELLRTRDFGKAGEAARDVIAKTQEGATYQPRSAKGQSNAQALGEFVEPITSKLREKIVDPVGDIPGVGPALAATMLAVPEALGAKKPRIAAERRLGLEKTTGEMIKPREGSLVQQLRSTGKAVDARVANAEDFLKQPTEPWVPREYAFERAPIKDALEGFPGQEQTKFNRIVPARKDLSYIDEIYEDPKNRSLIKQQITRGLPLGGETFYASLWPVYQEAMSRGIPREAVDKWVHRTTAASAQNTILNEQASGNLLHMMAQRGIEITPANVEREMADFQKRYGTGVMLGPGHAQGVARQLVEGGDPRSRLLRVPRVAADAPEYKIPTYAMQRSGDFAKSWVGDTHEASGETLGSRFHPYFKDASGFKAAEYGRAENHMLDIAGEMGIPGGMAQAGRWFGGGELTGLRSPRGDALHLLERQVAQTMHARGMPVSPGGVRDYVMNLITKGDDLLPWFKNAEPPEHRF